MAHFIAVIGTESHTTSSMWTKVSVNGIPQSHRTARSNEFLTKYGDKHASWCECAITAKDGDVIKIEAGSNTGNRGANRSRTNAEYVFDSNAEVVRIEGGGQGYIEGRFILKGDAIQSKIDQHQSLRETL